MNEPIDGATLREQMQQALAEIAVDRKPRRFAIHGLYRDDPDISGAHILGWGIEFRGGAGTIYTTPGGPLHKSDSAERVFRTMSIIGDVRLTWLDPEPVDDY